MSEDEKICICYVPTDAKIWAKYLQDKLREDEYRIETLLNDANFPKMFARGKVNVFLISPSFLELRDWKFMNDFDPRTCMVVLLSVEHDDFACFSNLKCFPAVQDWLILELDQTENSVRTLLIAIIGIFEQGTRRSMSLTLPGTDRGSSVSTSSLSSLSPSVSTCDASSEDDDPYDIPPDRTPLQVNRVADTAYSTKYQDCFYIFMDKRADDTLTLVFEGGTKMQAKETNKRVYSVHGNEEIWNGVMSKFEVHCKGRCLDTGSLEWESASGVRRRSRRQIIRQGSGLAPGEEKPVRSLTYDQDLDRRLAALIDIPDLDEDPFPAPGNGETSELPTLLHFGARFNLVNFCDQLLRNPLMFDALLKANIDGHLPHDVAKNAGHHELSHMLMLFTDYIKDVEMCFQEQHDSGYAGKLENIPRLTHFMESAPKEEDLPPKVHHVQEDPGSPAACPPPPPCTPVEDGYAKPGPPRPVPATRVSSLKVGSTRTSYDLSEWNSARTSKVSTSLPANMGAMASLTAFDRQMSEPSKRMKRRNNSGEYADIDDEDSSDSTGTVTNRDSVRSIIEAMRDSQKTLKGDDEVDNQTVENVDPSLISSSVRSLVSLEDKTMGGRELELPILKIPNITIDDHGRESQSDIDSEFDERFVVAKHQDKKDKNSGGRFLGIFKRNKKKQRSQTDLQLDDPKIQAGLFTAQTDSLSPPKPPTTYRKMSLPTNLLQAELSAFASARGEDEQRWSSSKQTLPRPKQKYSRSPSPETKFLKARRKEEEKKSKSKKKATKFIRDISDRKSMRVAHAKEDVNIKAPIMPEKRKTKPVPF